MPALEPGRGMRVVASAGALDRAVWHGDRVVVLRIAPDEAFGLGATGVEVDDPDAIVESEAGFAVARLGEADLVAVAARADWRLLTKAGELGQGKIAGVPSKVVAGEPTLLVTNAAYGDELRGRLRW